MLALMRSRRQDIWIVVIGAFVLLAAAILQPMGPFKIAAPFVGTLPELSPFHAVTGIPGPTCGITRSFVNVVHFRLADAFQAHLLGPLAFVGLFMLVAGRLVSLLTRKPSEDLWKKITPRRVVWGGVILVAAWAIKIAQGWY